MSSYDSIYKKMAASLGQNGAGHLHDASKSDPTRSISPALAHELNNVIAIIQGYSDRLLLRYHEDAALQPHLKLISEAAKRAATIIREAKTAPIARPPQNPAQPQSV